MDIFSNDPINSFTHLVRNTGITGCNWHYEYTPGELETYKEFIEKCEDCNAPVMYSCCNDELDPSPEAGGFCPTCKEHCL